VKRFGTIEGPKPYKASYVFHLWTRPLARKIDPFGAGVSKQALDSAAGAFRHGGLPPAAISTKRARAMPSRIC